MKEGVRYIEDILKEVAADKNMSKKEITELWKMHIEYEKLLMNQEDTLSIALPNFGVIYFNAFYNKILFNRFRNKGLSLDKNEKIYKLIEEDRKLNKSSLFKYPQNDRPVLYKVISQIYKIVFDFNKRYREKKRAIELVEKYNNNTLKETDFNENIKYKK